MNPSQSLTLQFLDTFKDPELAGQARVLEPIPNKPYRLGRMPGCDVLVNYNRCSRIHATIRWDDNVFCWQIVDGGHYGDGEYGLSRNGIYLNGKRIKPAGIHEDMPNPEPITFGDTITLGGVGDILLASDQHATWGAEEPEKEEIEPPPPAPAPAQNPATWAGTVDRVMTPPTSRSEWIWRGFLVTLGLAIAVWLLPLAVEWWKE